jgi:hypothetical protein
MGLDHIWQVGGMKALGGIWHYMNIIWTYIHQSAERTSNISGVMGLDHIWQVGGMKAWGDMAQHEYYMDVHSPVS